MPVDTAAKRRSLLGLGRPWVLLLLTPNSSVGSRDRKVFTFLYPHDWRGTPYSEYDHPITNYPTDGANR